MPFPATRRELKEAGYDFIAHKTCKCSEAMELWHTPADKMMPMNPMPSEDSPAVSHWATCRMAIQFRRASPSREAHCGESPDRTPPRKPTERAAPSASGQLFPISAIQSRRPKPNGKG